MSKTMQTVIYLMLFLLFIILCVTIINLSIDNSNEKEIPLLEHHLFEKDLNGVKLSAEDVTTLALNNNYEFKYATGVINKKTSRMEIKYLLKNHVYEAEVKDDGEIILNKITKEVEE